MAYETGTVSNSHSLVTALRTFLLDAGWTEQASINGYDYVFHSDGTSGDDDIYIRVAAGLSDAVSKIGDIQHPYTDGFTGFINLFAYQYFPSNGTSGTDGSNEIGKFGPVLYVAEDSGTTGHVNEYNIAKSTDVIPRYRKITDFLGNVAPLTSAFDGRRFLYQYTTNTTAINKVDLYDNSVASKAHATSNAGYISTPNYVRLEDGTEYIYQTSSNGGAGAVQHRYDIVANTWKYSGFPSDPPWGTGAIYSGSSCVGPRRTRTADNYWLYMFRGNSTTDWARFDINSETWSTAMTPSAPWAVGTANTLYKSFCLFVTKEQSGYTYDRIYLWRGNGLTNFASIAIGEDGDVPAGEVWETHQATPNGQFFGVNAVCIDNKILTTGGLTADRAVFKFVLPVDPSSIGQWDSATDSWFETGQSNSPNLFDLHYHLAGRIRVTESTTNTYWAFADKDRLVIVVKNDWGEYEYGYVGKFNSYSNPLTNGSLLETVAAGSNTINVSNPKFFEVGRTYTIVDTTGLNSSDVTSDFAGITRKLSPSETFTVLSSDPGGTLIVTELLAGYTVGSKVGEDPVPVMVRAHGSDKALTFDTINLVDAEGYKDPAWQYYRLIPMVSDSLANSTDLNERSSETFVYSISVINSGDAFTGKEARGQLIGVYAVGTGIASEAEISVGSSTYIAFDIADSGQTQRIVVGPK